MSELIVVPNSLLTLVFSDKTKVEMSSEALKKLLVDFAFSGDAVISRFEPIQFGIEDWFEKRINQWNEVEKDGFLKL